MAQPGRLELEVDSDAPPPPMTRPMRRDPFSYLSPLSRDLPPAMPSGIQRPDLFRWQLNQRERFSNRPRPPITRSGSRPHLEATGGATGSSAPGFAAGYAAVTPSARAAAGYAAATPSARATPGYAADRGPAATPSGARACGAVGTPSALSVLLASAPAAGEAPEARRRLFRASDGAHGRTWAAEEEAWPTGDGAAGRMPAAAPSGAIGGGETLAATMQLQGRHGTGSRSALAQGVSATQPLPSAASIADAPLLAPPPSREGHPTQKARGNAAGRAVVQLRRAAASEQRASAASPQSQDKLWQARAVQQAPGAAAALAGPGGLPLQVNGKAMPLQEGAGLAGR